MSLVQEKPVLLISPEAWTHRKGTRAELELRKNKGHTPLKWADFTTGRGHQTLKPFLHTSWVLFIWGLRIENLLLFLFHFLKNYFQTYNELSWSWNTGLNRKFTCVSYTRTLQEISNNTLRMLDPTTIQAEAWEPPLVGKFWNIINLDFFVLS